MRLIDLDRSPDTDMARSDVSRKFGFSLNSSENMNGGEIRDNKWVDVLNKVLCLRMKYKVKDEK